MAVLGSDKLFSVSRLELFEAVWTMPMREIGKVFGMSDVAARKICAKFFVPVPPKHHWPQRLAGHKGAKRPRLPLKPIGILGERLMIEGDLIEHEAAIAAGPKPESETIEAVRRRVTAKVRSVEPIWRTNNLPGDIASVWQERINQPRRDLDWRVFESPLEKRRILLIGTIAREVNRFGLKVAMPKGEPRCLRVRSPHVDVELVIDHEHWFPPHHDKRQVSMPADTPLRLTCGSGDWRDSRTKRIEDELTDICASIVVNVEETARSRVKHAYKICALRIEEHYELARKAAEKIDAEALAEQERVESELETLRSRILEGYYRAATLRKFVGDLRSDDRIASAMRNRVASIFEREADSIDPLLNGAISKLLEHHSD